VNRHLLNIRLFFLTKILLIFFLLCFKSYANELIVLGEKNAPVKIKIYSSLTCPHCANFHKNIVPLIEKNYVKSGEVQLIFMDFPLDQASLNASKILHCSNEERQIKLLNKIYEKQSSWASGSSIEQINSNLQKVVENLGINSSEFKKCLNNVVVEDKILNGRIEGQKKYSISSTPTIIINEKKFEGTVNFKNIKKKIEKLI
tara:strand:+ start:300 stop:905 length:606 start_codon:yes stop_codon:yes gene_type:complete